MSNKEYKMNNINNKYNIVVFEQYTKQLLNNEREINNMYYIVVFQT